jgi:hypothetical protein
MVSGQTGIRLQKFKQRSRLFACEIECNEKKFSILEKQLLEREL